MLLEVVTHGGKNIRVKVENYDPEELDKKLNNNELNTVLIGKDHFSRIDVKGVYRVVETEAE
ncbi:hypothetical protein BTR23_07515 [Alkalihalophilus pseudofirmus]|nr:hypothetical protein BTR23_07515 [Alkalihalophilus pseudofirmus]